MGAIADITNLVKTVTPALYAAPPTALWDSVTYKGKIWAIPEFKDAASTEFMLWDTRSVNRYGIMADITAPGSTTLAGLDKIVRKIRAQDPSFYVSEGGILPMSNYYYDAFGGPGGPFCAVRIDDKTLKVISPIQDDPETVANLKILRQWWQEGFFAPDQVTANASYKPSDLGAPIISKGSGWPSAASIWAGWNHNPDGVIPVEMFYGPQLTTSLARAISHFVGVNSTHKEEALKIMELICTDPIFRDMLAYGLEGKHFNYTTRPSGQTAGVARLTGVSWELPAYKTGAWMMSTPSGIKPVRSATIDNNGLVDNFVTEIAEQTNRAIPSVLMGFTFDVDGPGLRIVQNNLAAIYAKYSTILSLGAQDPAVLVPQIMKELNDAGLQRVITEAQRQINEWARTR
jgi:putative aldouronate transport system substrate-binding protein